MEQLPKHRLSTTDEQGKRVYLYPASVRGYFRDRKLIVQSFLMLFFLALPWVHWNKQQLVLLDIARREFFLFGLHFRAHDAPLLIFLFLAFAFLIACITAVYGRLWCGWACPQTVFTELVFRRIERWIEGGPRERRDLDHGPWNADKILKKTMKYSVFVAISLIVTHSFLAYFVGSRELIHMVTGAPAENWASFLVILFTTGIVLFDFGWFREQFCVIMCPYGRFQSVLLDSQSTVVAYDAKRGEPRRGEGMLPQGDCIACNRCVQVCPTGIDIRRGLQMECIGCTACIDACDEVMTKTKKPTGLIRYTTLAALAGRPYRFHTRAYSYAALFVVAIGALGITLGRKDFLEVAVLRARGLPYEVVGTGSSRQVVNHFRADLSNQTGKNLVAEFRLAPELARAGFELVMPMSPLPLKDGANVRADFFIRFAPGAVKGSLPGRVLLRSAEGERVLEVPLVGPDA